MHIEHRVKIKMWSTRIFPLLSAPNHLHVEIVVLHVHHFFALLRLAPAHSPFFLAKSRLSQLSRRGSQRPLLLLDAPHLQSPVPALLRGRGVSFFGASFSRELVPFSLPPSRLMRSLSLFRRLAETHSGEPQRFRSCGKNRGCGPSMQSKWPELWLAQWPEAAPGVNHPVALLYPFLLSASCRKGSAFKVQGAHMAAPHLAMGRQGVLRQVQKFQKTPWLHTQHGGRARRAGVSGNGVHLRVLFASVVPPESEVSPRGLT